jgi:hypothetical protein
VVYARKLGGTTYSFQVSGRLWRNSLVMMDRETGTSWSQVNGRAIDGKHRGAQLEMLDAVETTWQQWRTAHPETKLLKKTAEVQGSRYQEYFDDPERTGLFRAQWLADRMPGKTLVYGAAVGPHALAVTAGALGDGPVITVLGEDPVVVARGRDGGVRCYIAEFEGETVELRPASGSREVRDGGGSVWDLDTGQCTSGPRAGARLEHVAVTPVYWFAWSSFYPNTRVIDATSD